MNFIKIAMLGLALSASAALAQSAPATDDWNKIVAAAKVEKKVVFYASSTGGFNEKVIDAFTKKYGISVEFVGGRGNEFSERIRTEQIANRFAADVTVNGGDTLLQHLQDGNLQPHGTLPSTAASKTAPPAGGEGSIAPVYNSYYSLLINTNLVPENQEPKSWQDLLDPKWRGKIIIDDPRVVSMGSTRFRTMVSVFGEDYEKKLIENKPLMTLNQGDSRQRIARGEFAILAPDGFLTYIRNVEDGNPLPIKVIVPREGSFMTTFAGGILRNAPHPNAAKVFLDYLVSPEAQLIYAEAGYTPVVLDGVLNKLPDYVQRLMGAPPMKVDNLISSRDGLERAAKVYGGR